MLSWVLTLTLHRQCQCVRLQKHGRCLIEAGILVGKRAIVIPPRGKVNAWATKDNLNPGQEMGARHCQA